MDQGKGQYFYGVAPLRVPTRQPRNQSRVEEVLHMTLTVTELEQMRSVDIGAVDTQTPPNLDGAAFQILTSVQKIISSKSCHLTVRNSIALFLPKRWCSQAINAGGLPHH